MTRTRREHADAFEQLTQKHAEDAERLRAESEEHSNALQKQFTSDLHGLKSQLIEARTAMETAQQAERTMQSQLGDARADCQKCQRRLEEADARANEEVRLRVEQQELLRQSSVEAAAMRERSVQQMNEMRHSEGSCRRIRRPGSTPAMTGMRSHPALLHFE